MAERSNATVLKTVEVQASLGSNPSPSAAQKQAGFLSLVEEDDLGPVPCWLCRLVTQNRS